MMWHLLCKQTQKCVCVRMSSTCRGTKQSSNVHGIGVQIPPTGQRHWFSLIRPQPGTVDCHFPMCVCKKEKENTQDTHTQNTNLQDRGQDINVVAFGLVQLLGDLPARGLLRKGRSWAFGNFGILWNISRDAGMSSCKSHTATSYSQICLISFLKISVQKSDKGKINVFNINLMCQIVQCFKYKGMIEELKAMSHVQQNKKIIKSIKKLKLILKRNWHE